MHAGLGYMQQNLNYEGSNLDQWYPSNPSQPHDYVSGRVITYNTVFKVPYALVGFHFNTKKFNGSLTYAYSPFVTAENKDCHLLRNIVAKGYDDGSLNQIKFTGTYDFYKHFFATFSFDYLTIDTDGYDRQHHQNPYIDSKGEFHSDYWADIDNTITSEQITTLLSVGYKF
jgi:hypothetical protein